jgi:serine/threonine-protein kinase ATR
MVAMQNMVDGLGITGYEGVFLRVCEITLSILRAHRETLVSVLETFIHDPLVEWTKSHKSSGVEVSNPHAQVPFSLHFLASMYLKFSAKCVKS